MHETASAGFGVAAGHYRRARPGYPAEAVAALRTVAGIGSGTTVADVGAGTGILTAELVAAGARVYAVEPLASMRAELLATAPKARAVAAHAERLPVADGCLDAVTVAQAFHWFATPAAVSELVRVLRPGGVLALLWNIRDGGVDWIARLWDIVDEHKGDVPTFLTDWWREAVDGAAGLGPLQRLRFRHEQPLDRDALRARVLSISYIATLSDRDREAVLGRVDGLLDSHPETRGRTIFPLAYHADVWWATRA